MGDFSTTQAFLVQGIAVPLVSYDTWCQCTQVLLGCGNEAWEVRPDLYASGMTPLEAVRTMVLGASPGMTQH